MTFLQLLAVFACATLICACIRYAKYRYHVWCWRRAKKNFRTLRVADVVQYALPKSVVLASAVWITRTQPVIAMVLTAFAVGHYFQRTVEA